MLIPTDVGIQFVFFVKSALPTFLRYAATAIQGTDLRLERHSVDLLSQLVGQRDHRF